MARWWCTARAGSSRSPVPGLRAGRRASLPKRELRWGRFWAPDRRDKPGPCGWGGRRARPTVTHLQLDRSLAFHADGVGGLAMDSVITDAKRRLIHPQWRDERDDLQDDEGDDDVVDDDERGTVDLQQQLVTSVAVDQAGDAHAWCILVGADVFKHVRAGQDASQQTAGQGGHAVR